jgi:hypothetical protein
MSNHFLIIKDTMHFCLIINSKKKNDEETSPKLAFLHSVKLEHTVLPRWRITKQKNTQGNFKPLVPLGVVTFSRNRRN